MVDTDELEDVENVYFILSGGGAKGAFQWGAIKYLLEIGITPDKIYGVSVGSLNAALTSSLNPKLGDDIWNNLCQEKVYNGNPYLRFMMFQESFYSSNPLKQLIYDTVEKIKFQVPVNIVALSLSKGKTHLFSERDDEFKDALCASTAIPILFPPVSFNDDLWVDGGVLEISPVKWAINQKKKPDLIVSISMGKNKSDLKHLSDLNQSDLNSLNVLKSFLPFTLNEMFRQDFDRFKHINNTVRQIQEQNSDFIYKNPKTGDPYEYYNFLEIKPDDDIGSAFNFNNERMINLKQLGYQKAKHAVSQNQFLPNKN